MSGCCGKTSGVLHGACYYIADQFSSLGQLQTVVNTKKFIADNGKRLMIYFAVWCVIILGAGAIYGGLTPGGVVYGFKAVSLPLTIGMSCGFAFGGICGILTVKVFDPQNKKHGTNTPWGFAHTHLKKIDEDVRKLLISVCVTLLLSAAVAYPYAIGAILGIVIMWQIVVQLYLGKEPDSASKNTETQELIPEGTNEGAEVPDDHDAGEEATGVSSSMEA